MRRAFSNFTEFRSYATPDDDSAPAYAARFSRVQELAAAETRGERLGFDGSPPDPQPHAFPMAASIAFTGYNADGGDNLAFVALEAIASGTIITFTDNEWNAAGTGFTDFNESTFSLTLTSAVAAGTIITIDTIGTAASTTSNSGTIASVAGGGGNRGFAAGGDTVYAYVADAGTPLVPTTFLAAITTNTGGFTTAASGFLTGTGLVAGTSALDLSTVDAGADIGAFNLARNSEASFAAYAAIINTAANWVTEDTAADDGANTTNPDVPFNSTAFTLAAAGENQVVSIAVSPTAQNEGGVGTSSPYTFTISRTGGTTGALTFTATFNTGTTDAADYLNGVSPTTFSSSILDGQTSATFIVNVRGDGTFESNESFDYTISAPANAAAASVTVGTGTAVATITNDDTEPQNNAPTVDLDADDGSGTAGSGFASAYTEGGAAAAISDVDVDIADPDAGDDIVSATITITNPESGDTLNIGTLPGAVTVDPSSTAIMVRLVAAPGTSAAEFEAAIEAITFSSTSDDPTDRGTNTSRTVSVVVNDGTADSVAATATISIADDNADAPSGTSATIFATKDEFRLLTEADFGTVDVDGTFASVTITQAAGGRVYFDADGTGGPGAPVIVTLPQIYTAQDLLDGKVSFRGDPGSFGPDAGFINFAVTDDDGNTDGSPNLLTVNIADVVQSQVVNFAVTSVSVAEGNAGPTAYTFTVTRSGGTDGQLDFTLGFAVGNSDAADYDGGALPSGLSGSILDGETSTTVTIDVAGDTAIETNESFILNITGVTNAAATPSIGVSSAAGATIVNDDAPAGATLVGGIPILAEGESLAGSAAVPIAGNGIGLVRLGATPGTGATAAGRAESLSYDPVTGRVFVTNVANGNDLVDVFQINADGSLTQLAGINLAGFTQIGTINSVAVKNGVIAISYDNVTAGLQGFVALFDTATLTLQNLLQVGVLPDQVTFTPDGSKLLVANEAEAVSSASNAVGTISIIDLSGGAASATVQSTIRFDALNGGEAALRALGLPIFTGQSAAADIEPEYISVSADGTLAYVTLQEVNAVAVIDLTNPNATEPLAILPLGFINRNLSGNQFDPSDQDGVDLGNWPVLSALQPDAIATFVIAGETYFITANEGDSRVGGLADEARLSTRDLDDTLFPNEAFLKMNANVGRLNVLTDYGDTDSDGDLDQIYTFGGRGFSIFKQNADGTIVKVRESGGEFERIIAFNYSAIYNIDSGNTNVDDRSDNKGPEPEGVTIGVVGGRTYAFIGLERIGGVITYDVTDPANAFYVGYTPRNAADAGPETILFIAAADNPTGLALVLTANEVSGTTTVYRVDTPPPGAQIVSGSVGNDNFFDSGTPNPDIFYLQQGGADVVSGQGGDDGFYFGAAYSVSDTALGGDGVRDQIGLQGDYSVGSAILGNLTGTELVVLLPGNDTRFGGATGTLLTYNIITNQSTVVSDNRLTIQANTLRAGENFNFSGAATAIDLLIYAGFGTDNLTGGSGNDGFFFGQGRFGAGDVVNGGAGTLDQLGLQGDFAGPNAITFAAGQLSGLEFIVLLSANDPRFGFGGSVVAYELTMIDDNVAAGEILVISANALAPAEFLAFNGSAELDGSFHIFSGACNDILLGSQNDDEIFGGAGFDIIFGNGGADQLTGGAGDDVFAYAQLTDSAPAAADSILDFTLGDTIDLLDLAANTGVSGGTFEYIGGAAQSGERQLQVIQTGNNATVSIFVDADAVADLVINVTVSDGHVLTEADFAGVSPNSNIVPLAAASTDDFQLSGRVKADSPDGFLDMAFLKDFGGPDFANLIHDVDFAGGSYDLLV